MYKLQQEILNEIKSNIGINHLITAANCCGQEEILVNISEFLKQSSNYEVICFAPLELECIELNKKYNCDFEHFPCSWELEYFLKQSNKNLTLIFKDLARFELENISDVVEELRKNNVNINIIATATSCNIENYKNIFKFFKFKTYHISAFDTPNFKNISLNDLLTRDFSDLELEDSRFISPKYAQSLLKDCNNDINSYEFKTRVLGLL